ENSLNRHGRRKHSRDGSTHPQSPLCGSFGLAHHDKVDDLYPFNPCSSVVRFSIVNFGNSGDFGNSHEGVFNIRYPPASPKIKSGLHAAISGGSWLTLPMASNSPVMRT